MGDELLVRAGDLHAIGHLRLIDGELAGQWGTPKTLQRPHLMSYDEQGLRYITEVHGKRVQVIRKAK